MNIPFKAIVFATITAALVDAHSVQAAPPFIEGTFEIIDTHIQQTLLNGPDILGVWFDNENIILNALQDDSNAEQKHLDRVVLFNVKTRKSTALLESGRFQCYEPKTKIASIVKDGVMQFVNIGDDGRFRPRKEATPLNKFRCRSEEPSLPGRLQAFLREGDGYIDEGRTGGGFSEENAILHRPGQPPLELPAKGGELTMGPIYLPFLNRYLLNYSDNLNPNILPRGKPVYRIMTSEGSITEIPQPRLFFDAMGSLGRMWFMRDGMVFKKTSQSGKNAGLFFLKEEQIIRIFGADNLLADRLQSSPDGCKLAFLAFKNLNFDSPKTVKILNLCGEK